MDWLQALIMGIVQGLAEFLPISSSGHLEICREILHLDLPSEEALDFDVMLHAATVLATIVVLWREFFPLCKSFFTVKRDDNFYFVCKILVSCIPVGIVGVCFKKQVESFFGHGLTIVGVCLCITALLLTFSYFFRTRPLQNEGTKAYTPRNIGWWDAFVIGLAQAVAVLPGLSRSGTTIATGILLGNKREQVAHFSFLMVIIPILGESLLNVVEMLHADAAAGAQTATTGVGGVALTIGFLSSFIVGCMACKWMIEIVKKGKLIWFALYCALAGALCIFF